MLCCRVMIILHSIIRELGVPLVTGDIPGVAVILGTAPSVEEGVAL